MPVVSGDGYQSTLSQIQTEIWRRLSESEGDTHWPQDKLDSYVNQALNIMRLKGMHVNQSYTFVNTADEQTFTPPGSVWKIYRINYDDEMLRQMTLRDFHILTGGDLDTSSGTPELWWQENTGGLVWFDKVPSSAKTVKVWYWGCPVDIAGDSELVGFFHVFNPIVVEGALWFARQAERNYEMGEAHKQTFYDLIQDGVFHTMRQNLSETPEAHDPYGWSVEA